MFIPTQYQRAISCNLQCGICFDDLDDKVLHSALLPCQHYFCNECWSLHISKSIKEGVVSITCPEYECGKNVDPVFVKAMVKFEDYALHEAHLTEFTLFSQKKANWCPKER